MHPRFDAAHWVMQLVKHLLSRVEGFVHQIPVLEVWWMLQGKCLDPLEDWWDVLEGPNQQRDPVDVKTMT
ncbi:hypothetical protein ACOMHN_040476 [Nucella lapillus]